MKLTFTEAGWADYLWFQQNDKKLLKKINTLIKDIQRSPFEGVGKPESYKSKSLWLLVATYQRRTSIGL